MRVQFTVFSKSAKPISTIITVNSIEEMEKGGVGRNKAIRNILVQRGWTSVSEMVDKWGYNKSQFREVSEIPEYAKVKILGINDDCHETYFISEFGNKWNNKEEFIKFLVQPHTQTFQIVVFACYELEDENLIQRSKLMEDVYFIEQNYKSGKIEMPFTRLWNNTKYGTAWK